MTRTTNERRARAILEAATRLTAELPDVERNLDDSLAGWPAAASDGGNTRYDDDPNSDQITDPTLGTEDRARHDHDRLTKLLKLVNGALGEADAIRLRWARPRLDGTTVAQQLAKADELIWCTSCLRAGCRNVRTNGTRCEFCSSIHAEYGIDPPKALLEIHGYRRVNATDRERHMRPLVRAAKKGRK